MRRGDLLFVDTNILLSATDTSRQDYATCRTIIERSVVVGIHLVVSGQVVREYLVVATRPTADNGLGMAPSDAVANVQTFRTYLHVLPEPTEVTRKLISIVDNTGVHGKRIHDANIAATMWVHGVTTIITANTGDYSNLPDVIPLTPVSAATELNALSVGSTAADNKNLSEE